MTEAENEQLDINLYEYQYNTNEANKLKIGVMTFWESQENYGQLLQAYAFQAHLRKKGYEPYLIKYRKAGSVKRHKPGMLKRLVEIDWRKTLDMKAVSRKLNSMVRKLAPIPNRGFEEFKKAYLKFSPKIYTSIDELKQSPPQADIYITGSDQVWNYKFIGDYEPYFLQFGDNNTKRMSYAASFGHSELPETVRLKYSRYMADFQNISVREGSGVRLCREMGFGQARMAPDPTLLLKPEDWRKLSRENEAFSSAPGKKVFIYTLGNRSSVTKDQTIDFVTKLPGTTVAHTSVHNDKPGNVFPTIQEWLGYIKDCDVVITNSFHAMLFSTILNKKFIGLPSAGDKAGMNERLNTLVNEFGLAKQLLYTFDKKRIDQLMHAEIDWDLVNARVDYWRNEADRYLKFA